MRLLLDAHISGRHVAPALTHLGHDVRALDQEATAEGLPDVEILTLAAIEGRIVVTANSKDPDLLAREWGREGRRHAGCILFASSIRQEWFGLVIRGILQALDSVPTQAEWVDRVYWVRRRG